MREFTLQHWREALSKVFARAALDPAYRELCLTDPREAVRGVSDIQLPPGFRFEFVDESKKILSSLLLPPLLAPIPGEREREAKDVHELTNWYVAGYPFNSPLDMHTIGGGGTHGGGSASGTGTGTGTGGGSTGGSGGSGIG